MKTIDLRSDTVTRPTPAMRRAMAEAEVGDNFYGDDPTVRRLEEQAAALLGKPAAMLVLSGTMGNLLCLLAGTERGDAVLLSDVCHIYLNEGGSMASIAGLLPTLVNGPLVTPEQVLAAIRPPSILGPRLSLVCLENTHNVAGGSCLTVAQSRAIGEAAHGKGLRVHLDGARLFNAAVALGVGVHDLVAGVDSVTFCLSKGLGCPVGSIVAGERDFIERARRWRQAIGGGMRQAGVFAAAGLVAFDTMIDRLADDHRNARRLGDFVREAGLRLVGEVATNMVFAEVPTTLMDADAFVAALGVRGLRVNPPKGNRIRFVTHADVSAADIEEAGQRLLAAARSNVRQRQSAQ
ncbi:MAG TPA: GntG family PLP-dependent aldolase [Verrucomicrobiae bacterium]|nr:GntG family PLP-dependent aldolase [Verrucomicrobiae bacterium]